MPWLVPSQVDFLSSSPSQRECERTSFSFYCSVRDRLPVWRLEEQRSMATFSWQDGPRGFLPAEALLYAVVHDHRDYASFLLQRFSVRALRAPPCSFCRCSGGAPHLSVAVRYDRLHILALMLAALKDCGERRDFLDGRAGCSHAADAGKSAVHLAVELSRSDCLLLLLSHGAAPAGLEGALQRLSSASELRQAQRCMDFLLLFLPSPPPLCCLQDEPQRWQCLLGNEVFRWLSGLAPPPPLAAGPEHSWQ
ncbi:hypothetical protein CgunFtcFv8_012412 [Champsocephalus gunnari]|uniref:Ankyrin repeat domain 9 n=1 Tax=Champsocephalus gunnari TaxID=52237 RepID=A0AAN8HML9_CHAGU|nr:hypothetical protein CgunFtcFv8_012412 [Champsocephalus gunnari]